MASFQFQSRFQFWCPLQTQGMRPGNCKRLKSARVQTAAVFLEEEEHAEEGAGLVLREEGKEWVLEALVYP